MADDYLNVDGFEWWYVPDRGWVLDVDGVDVSVSVTLDGVVVDEAGQRLRWRSMESLEDVLREVALWAIGA